MELGFDYQVKTGTWLGLIIGPSLDFRTFETESREGTTKVRKVLSCALGGMHIAMGRHFTLLASYRWMSKVHYDEQTTGTGTDTTTLPVARIGFGYFRVGVGLGVKWGGRK